MILLINNTCHTTIKMKPIDVKSNCYAEGNVESNEKDPQFEVSGHVRNTKKFLLNDILQIGLKNFL